MTLSSRRVASRTSRLAGTILVCAAVASAPPAWAQSAEDVASAKKAIVDARALRAQGDFAGALPKFKAAYALVPTPVTGLDLASTLSQLGRLVEARTVALAVVRMPNAGTEDAVHAKARADVQALADQLRPRIPSLTVVVTGAVDPAQTRVAVDGQNVPREALAERQVDPGHHKITVTNAGNPAGSSEVDLKEGEARTVTIDLPAAAIPLSMPPPVVAVPAAGGGSGEAAVAPDADRGSSGSGRRTLGYVVGGAGIVGLGIGAYFGVTALSKWSDAKNLCGAGCAQGSPAYAKRSDAESAALGSTVGLVAGGVLAAAGIVILVTAPRGRAVAVVPVAMVGGGGAIVNGTF